jgi:Flp pilus assembly protein TadD
MEQSELMLQLLGKQGSKEKAFEPFKLADGVITTPFMVMSDDKPIIAKDNFQRTLSFKSDAVINYLVNSSVVRPSELKDSDIKALDDFLNENGSKANYQFKSATITSYASPEGEISLNENLAVERANSAQKTITDVMKRRKVEAGEGFFNLVPKGEDWLGFKSKMEASNIADKALILRILEMYSDNTKREQEIKNLAATYVEISDKILPELRRSEIVINYDVVGLSDEQIIAYARSAKADTLTVEEMLYATTLTDDMNEQYAIYKKASETYPNDYRAFNNLGVIHLRKNELTEADKHFKMANDIEKNGIATNNMAVIQRLNGDRAAAKATLKGAAGAGDEVNYNLGIIDIQDGNYASAIQNMKGYNTFNKALAQVLSGSTEAAKTTLDQAPEKDTAEGQYLRAIIAARANDSAAVASSLKAAYALDASLKEKAAKDLEFRNFKDQIQ